MEGQNPPVFSEVHTGSIAAAWNQWIGFSTGEHYPFLSEPEFDSVSEISECLWKALLLAKPFARFCPATGEEIRVNLNLLTEKSGDAEVSVIYDLFIQLRLEIFLEMRTHFDALNAMAKANHRELPARVVVNNSTVEAKDKVLDEVVLGRSTYNEPRGKGTDPYRPALSRSLTDLEKEVSSTTNFQFTVDRDELFLKRTYYLGECDVTQAQKRYLKGLAFFNPLSPTIWDRYIPYWDGLFSNPLTGGWRKGWPPRKSMRFLRVMPSTGVG